ncbi:MAG: hypothetical protein WCC17_00905 [Candidatus Nitrosopolaris sp.]
MTIFAASIYPFYLDASTAKLDHCEIQFSEQLFLDIGEAKFHFPSSNCLSHSNCIPLTGEVVVQCRSPRIIVLSLNASVAIAFVLFADIFL